jgi:hypothetical protein
MEMQQKGPLFSMFNRIGLCVSLKIFIYLFIYLLISFSIQANGVVGFGCLNWYLNF